MIPAESLKTSDVYKRQVRQLPQLRFIRSEVAAHFLQRCDQARAGTGVVEAHKLAFFKGDVQDVYKRQLWRNPSKRKAN